MSPPVKSKSENSSNFSETWKKKVDFEAAKKHGWANRFMKLLDDKYWENETNYCDCCL